MKNEEMFKALSALNEEFLNEAEDLPVPAARKKPATLLKILLPAAAAILLAAMLFAVLPLHKPAPLSSGEGLSPLTAASPDRPIGDILKELSYEIHEGTAVITGYRGSSDYVVLPDEIEGRPVTGIDIRPEEKGALPDAVEVHFSGSCLTTLNLPGEMKLFLAIGRDVEYIDPSLLRTKQLVNVSVHAENAVYASLDGILYDKSFSELIACPGGYEKERGSVDAGASNAFVLPQGLRTVCSRAFDGCGVYEVLLPEGVETLESEAFANCEKLRTFYLPASAVNVSADLFAGCRNLAFLVTGHSSEAYEELRLKISSSEKVFTPLSDNVSGEEYERVVSAFENAEEFLSYFSRFNNIPCDSGTVHDGRFLVMYNGVQTISELRDCSYRFFTEDFDLPLQDPVTGEMRFAYGPDGLYTAPASIPAEYNDGQRSYALSATDGGFLLTLRIKVDCGSHFLYWENVFFLENTLNGLRLSAPVTLPAEEWYPLYIQEINF